MSNDTRILIGIPSGEIPRYNDFYTYLEILDKPPGTFVTRVQGQSPARNRNLIVREALRCKCTHILFIDDDMAFPPNSLNKLLAHDKDVISALYLMRQHPHRPVIFDTAFDDGRCVHTSLNGQRGLIKVAACGFGFLLVKTHVFSKLSEPYITLGQIEKDSWCDDLEFCKKLREAKFDIYSDLNCPVGHHCNVIAWPSIENNKWTVVYDSGGVDVVGFSMRD